MLPLLCWYRGLIIWTKYRVCIAILGSTVWAAEIAKRHLKFIQPSRYCGRQSLQGCHLLYGVTIVNCFYFILFTCWFYRLLSLCQTLVWFGKLALVYNVLSLALSRSWNQRCLIHVFPVSYDIKSNIWGYQDFWSQNYKASRSWWCLALHISLSLSHYSKLCTWYIVHCFITVTLTGFVTKYEAHDILMNFLEI